MSLTLGLVGGRGYSGSELLSLLARHSALSLAFASSSSHEGRPLRESCPAWPGDEEFCGLNPEDVGSREADAWALALPNGAAAAWAAAIRAAHPDSVILDFSADHRFDDDWAYGLPERFRDRIGASKQISNPGCYATGAQLGLLPVLDYLVGTPVVFGVSGYSGAGRTPGQRNDPGRLRDNLMPYSLSGHLHEREISSQLGLNVRFIPHVAAFFRGISLTISAQVDHAASEEKLLGIYSRAYSGEPRVKVRPDIPELREASGTPDVHIGGFAVDGRDPTRFTLVVTLDNLLKGAASQALQNLNLALGLEENTGIGNE